MLNRAWLLLIGLLWLLWALLRLDMLRGGWLPAPDVPGWNTLFWCLVALTVLLAVQYLYNLAVHLWREMSD